MRNESARTILLVEDEALIALAERAVLERAGYRVIIARTGEDAVGMVTTDDSIELVLMDVDLGPGMDGPTAAERILKTREIPLAFLSSHNEQLVGKVVQIFPAGANLVPTVRVDDFALDARSLSAFGLIVNELITNAMKYAFNGHPRPELLVSVEREGGCARLVVKDNGPGLPETSTTDGLHDAVSPDPSAAPGPSSFGLSMVRSLADQLGGSARLESDRGVRAVVEFPVPG